MCVCVCARTHPQHLSQPLLQSPFQAVGTRAQLLPAAVSAQGMLQPPPSLSQKKPLSIPKPAPLVLGRSRAWDQPWIPVPASLLGDKQGPELAREVSHPSW